MASGLENAILLITSGLTILLTNSFRFVQPSKVFSPIEAMFLPIVTIFTSVLSLNTELAMAITLNSVSSSSLSVTLNLIVPGMVTAPFLSMALSVIPIKIASLPLVVKEYTNPSSSSFSCLTPT